MLLISPFSHAIVFVAVFMLVLVGCDQQQPITQKPTPDPGFKPGETLPIEPQKGPARNRDGNVPLAPATAPTTPGEQNTPAAPALLPPSPTTSYTQRPRSTHLAQGKERTSSSGLSIPLTLMSSSTRQFIARAHCNRVSHLMP